MPKELEMTNMIIRTLLKKTRVVAVVLAVLLIIMMVGVAGAGSSANYAIDWQVLTGGGAPASGGNVTLNGSLGQTAIGPASGGNVNVGSGYWFGIGQSGGDSGQPVYLPIILRAS